MKNQNKTGAPLPKAIIARKRFTWMYWLVPVGALIMGGYFLYRDFISAGPTITIYFQNAEGVEVKNTQMRYRGANVGEVKSLELTKDHERIKITVQLEGFARELAKEGSIFWIVRPQLRVGSISGLRTIVSGEYIGVQPGNGTATNTFTGAEQPPNEMEPNALQIVLHTPDLGSLQELSPIFYRGIKVGEVLHYQLANDSREVMIHARIFADYAPLVQSNSRFWNAGGIDVHFGLIKGIQISAESPATVLSGGIEFATPQDAGGTVSNGVIFNLFEKPEEKWKTWTPSISLKLPDHVTHSNSMPSIKMK